MQLLPDASPDASSKQSNWLVAIVGSTLVFFAVLPFRTFVLYSDGGSFLYISAGVLSLTFGLLVWALRAATPAAAFFGAVICDILIVWTSRDRHAPFKSALIPLALLFLLTFVGTRLGKHRRPALTSIKEARRGRNAAQVIANLSVAALVIPGGIFNLYDWIPARVFGVSGLSILIFPILVLAALAEATADTVSSELGQAFGGTPYLLMTLRPVPVGTDGGISLLGTAAGITGAALVTAAGAWAMNLGLREALTALAGAIAGLFFDSLMGATVERRGWLNNDLVNFSSTAFAALVTLFLLAI